MKKIIKFLDDLSPSELKLRDLPRKPDGLYNLAFNEYGQEVKRAGHSGYNTSLGAGKILGIHRFYKQNTLEKEFIIAWGTKIYKISDDTPWGATALKSKAATDYTQNANATYFETFANHCYIANGEDNLQKYNGTYVRSVNMTVPGAPTDNSRVSGSLTEGIYYFCYTFVDEDGYESNGGTASAAITVGAGENGIKINISNYPGHITFVGEGLDDATAGGIFTGDTPISYSVQIDGVNGIKTSTLGVGGTGYAVDDTFTVNTGTVLATGKVLTVNAGVVLTYSILTSGSGYTVTDGVATTKTSGAGTGLTINITVLHDTFKWSDDGGSTWDGTLVAITGAAQTLNNGVTIYFEATTGHTLNENWQFTATVDPKIAKRRIYRTTVGGSIYYYDGEVANNTTITYDSIISDEVISLKSVLHTDHNAPPDAPDLVVKRLSRMNIAVDDDLYVSKNYDKTTGVRSVEYFPSTNYFPTGNGQNITGLIEQLGGLPVFTENTIERLVGTDEDNFEFRNAHQEDGCIAKRSVVNCKNYVVYLAFSGIYIFDGVSARAIDVAFGGRLNKYIRNNINYSYAHLSCATYYDNKYLLCIPTGANTTPNVTIYFDFETKSYGVYSFAFSCFSRWDKGGDGLSLKGGSNTIGRVYSVFSGLDDDGSAITAYDDIEPLDFGRPEVYRQWYSIFIKIKTTSGTALAMYYTLDNNTETSSIMVSRDDIAFVDGGAGADTITTVAGDFVAAGFKTGDVIVVTGTDSNNGNMTIVSVVAKTITLAIGIVTAEAAGDAILTKAKVLTENTTKWYRISLGSGGKCARALKPRPYMSDKFAFEIHGLAICYDEEPFAEEKE